MQQELRNVSGLAQARFLISSGPGGRNQSTEILQKSPEQLRHSPTKMLHGDSALLAFHGDLQQLKKIEGVRAFSDSGSKGTREGALVKCYGPLNQVSAR